MATPPPPVAPRPLLALLRSRLPQVLLGLALGAAALALALRGVPGAEIRAALAGADLRWLLVVAAIFLLQQVIRAWRQALLLQALHPHHRFRTSLSVLCVSFFLINTLPARIGELARPLLLLERDGIPLGSGAATVVIERALDLLSAFLMLALVAWFVPVPSRELVLGGRAVDWVGLGRAAAAGALPVLCLGILALLFAGRPLLALLSRLSGGWRTRLLSPFLRFGGSFVDAVEAVRSPGRLAAVLALTAATWALSGLMYPPLALAFGVGEHIGYGEGIGLLAITMMGMIVPSAPGFAGTYEAFFRAGLALFGVAGPGLDGTAVAMALVFHWWQYGVQSLTAAWFLAVDRISLGRLLERLRSGA